MNYGIVLPAGHEVRVHRTNKPTKSFTIVSHKEFKDADGNVYDQQAVFGETYASVDVIDPVTGETTHY
jgi:hypothetical protein